MVFLAASPSISMQTLHVKVCSDCGIVKDSSYRFKPGLGAETRNWHSLVCASKLRRSCTGSYVMVSKLVWHVTQALTKLRENLIGRRCTICRNYNTFWSHHRRVLVLLDTSIRLQIHSKGSRGMISSLSLDCILLKYFQIAVVSCYTSVLLFSKWRSP